MSSNGAPSDPNVPKDQESLNNVDESDPSLLEGMSSNEDILARIISSFPQPPLMDDQAINDAQVNFSRSFIL